MKINCFISKKSFSLALSVLKDVNLRPIKCFGKDVDLR